MLKHCPISGVNICRFAACIVAGFLFLWGFEYLVHGHLLMGMYNETPGLWRSDAEMQNLLPFTLMTRFLIVYVTAFIFTRHFESTGLGEGLRYGIMIGMIMGIMLMSQYAWLPVSKELATAWFASGLLEGIGLGLIYAGLYRR